MSYIDDEIALSIKNVLEDDARRKSSRLWGVFEVICLITGAWWLL